MDLAKQRLDQEKSVNGVWFDYPDTDIRLKIARAYNPSHAEMLDKLSDALTETQKNKLEGQQIAYTEPFVDAMANCVLVDWENVQWEGEELPYSVENAKMILNDKDLEHFYAFVVESATTLANYRREEIKTAAKKSKRTSSGKKRGGNTKRTSKK